MFSGDRDPESAACLSCHDGATASDIGSHAVAAGWAPETGEHPIGVRVDRPNRDRDECRMRPVGLIDPRVRLFDRAVGCGSCHSVYSKEENQLVMSNSRSALCLACHLQ